MQDRKKLKWVVGAAFCCATSAFAATPVDLSHAPASVLQTFISSQKNLQNSSTASSDLKQTSRETDFNQTDHIRVQQMYQGYPVWGGDAIVHIPHGSKKSLASAISTGNSGTTMDGTVYQGLNKDLVNTPAYVFNSAQSARAIQQAIQQYQKASGIHEAATAQKSKLIVYVDAKNKAHWAFLVSFDVKPVNLKPVRPTYILDAITFAVYQNWNDIKTLDTVNGGGFGGNPKMGKLVYDSLQSDLSELTVQRDAAQQICYLENTEVTVKDVRKNDQIIQYSCNAPDSTHNNLFWDADQDASNGAYSPGNDALFIGKVVKDMYQQWYNIPVLKQADGSALMLNMRVHDTSADNIENAYWDDSTQQMTFGDGQSTFYPLVSLGVAAHEISHGFTHQHSNLTYTGQSGGLNESYSDMAAMGAEYFSRGTNTWQIGSEIMKAATGSLRYMDNPSKDCAPRGKPGVNCSISSATQYKNGTDVHFSSGVFNRAFYLIATAPNWDTHKAFDVMVQANRNYWTANATFQTAACGVVKATKDFQYDQSGVTAAMKQVGIDVSKC